MDWLTLPELIFNDIMMIVGLEMIIRDIWESENKKKIMKAKIEKNWGPGMFPPDEEISHAKWLGDYCLLLKIIRNIMNL